MINTDAIDVVGPSDEPTTLDLAGGRLAPGYSAEPGGDPEIELDVDGGGGEATLVVRGTPYRDRWRAGGAGDAASVNLNPGEPEPDADVVAVGMHHLVLRPGDGEGIDTIPGGLEGVRGSDGPDVLRGTAGPDILYGHSGGDVLEGRGVDGGGVGPRDTADYGDAPGPVTVNLSKWGPQPTGGAGADQLIGIDDVVGSPFADSLTGTRYANRIEGGGGADVIDGGLGSDVLDGGFGVDTLTYAGRTAAVAVRLDGLRNDGADPDRDGISEAHEEADHSFGFENATGGAGPDRLFSPSRVVNVLAGRGGADRLDARDGSTAADVLRCGTGEGDTVRRDPTDTKQDCEAEAP